MASYVGDVCALAVNNRVALDASFVAVALAVKVVEGLVVDLQPDFPLRRNSRAHVSEGKLHARVARGGGAHERLHERAAAAERGGSAGEAVALGRRMRTGVFSVVLGYS